MRAFLLAGGRSRRMGRDKAQLELAGQPLAAHMLGKLAGLGLEATLCGNRPDLQHFAPILPDPKLPGGETTAGPIAGILSALEASDSVLNLFLAVDMPAIPADFLSWMIDRGKRTQAAITLPIVTGREQPLCAIYHRDLAPGVRRSIESGEHRVLPALHSAVREAHSIDVFDVESIVSAGAIHPIPSGLPHQWFRNLNSPRDFARYVVSHLSNKLERESAD